MNLQEFKTSLTAHAPPQNLSKVLQALWYDAKDQWHVAHELAQSVANANGAWVHAYLHRKEGDVFNAAYWYSRAARNPPKIPLTEEWEKIAETLLKL